MLINTAAFLKFSIDPLLQVMKSIFDGWDRIIWLPVFNLQCWGLKKLCAAFQEASITSVLFASTIKKSPKAGHYTLGPKAGHYTLD